MFPSLRDSAAPYSKQLERTVIRRRVRVRWRAASGSLHYAMRRPGHLVTRR